MAYIIPRSNDCILGGTADEGREDLAPDPATADAILERCVTLEPRLREGTKLSEVFRAISFTPPMLVGLTKVGESASDLPRVLGEAGDALAARAQEKTERFLSILTPAIVLLIGLVVGGIVLVVFQGLMSISDMVEL